ncbi:MAG TPA: winged helix-turn-helix domain-containing protein [Candidatus Sulfotelmatobacter sp.]|nr:winged helix-turn-helix domain-containing protein [Candidatus Sulfotelmatobacter sp.]
MASRPLVTTVVRFGEFELELRTGALRRGTRLLKLQPQPAKILSVLVSRAGEIVTRQELAEEVWGSETFVDFDQGLNFAIRQIRVVLDDVAEEPRFLDTVHRKGYRFIASVEPVAPTEGPLVQVQPLAEPRREPDQPNQQAGRQRSRKAVALVIVGALLAVMLIAYFVASRSSRRTWNSLPTLVVLPLQNLSGDPSQEYFADGMTDELTTQLAKVRSLRVISRTSAMMFKNTQKTLPEIARELKVNFVVEGSVIRSGDRVKLTVQLIDASSDEHIWADSYEQELGDTLSAQKRVALEVVDGIEGGLTPEERSFLSKSRSVNPQAYEDSFRGRFFWNRRTESDVNKALTYFQKAIAEDPLYAPAHAGLAEVYLASGSYSLLDPGNAYRQARAEAQKAVELDHTLSEGYVVLGIILAEYDWDLASAEKQFLKALALSPSNPRAHQFYAEDVLEPQARYEEANRELAQAQELDPAQFMPRAAAGFAFYLARQYDRVIKQEQETLELNPSFPKAHYFLGLALVEQKKYGDAIREFETAESLDPNPSYSAAIAYVDALQGKKKEAGEIIARLESSGGHHYVHPYLFVFLYSALGDQENALRWLDRAEKERCWFLLYLNVDPRYDGLRPLPRFQSLARRILGAR